jgi:hypothetical protein
MSMNMLINPSVSLHWPVTFFGGKKINEIAYLGRQVSPFLQATKALRESRGIALLCF